MHTHAHTHAHTSQHSHPNPPAGPPTKPSLQQLPPLLSLFPPASHLTSPTPLTPPGQVWLRMCMFKLRGGGPHAGAAASRALDRALAAVPKRKHVKLISRFGMLEYRHG